MKRLWKSDHSNGEVYFLRFGGPGRGNWGDWSDWLLERRMAEGEGNSVSKVR